MLTTYHLKKKKYSIKINFIKILQLNKTNLIKYTTHILLYQSNIWYFETDIPFLIKIKPIKTIKGLSFRIMYQYIMPKLRQYKTFRYYKFLSKNSSPLNYNNNLKKTFSLLLKI